MSFLVIASILPLPDTDSHDAFVEVQIQPTSTRRTGGPNVDAWPASNLTFPNSHSRTDSKSRNPDGALHAIADDVNARRISDLNHGSAPVAIRGGLAPWQERRAKEILSANLDGRVMLRDVARECGLSASHFSRAFHRTIGAAPHHWLLKRRVEVAKEKLRDRRLSLSEVALACGFSDQSHLTRVFTRFVGTSPGAWRRSLVK